MFAVRIKQIVDDPTWRKRLIEAKTTEQVASVIERFCKENNLATKEVKM